MGFDRNDRNDRFGRFNNNDRNDRSGRNDQNNRNDRPSYGNDRFDRRDSRPDQDRRFEPVYANKVRAGKRRTYFFDVHKTRGEDYYLTITESTKRMDDSYARHKIFVYKEDFNRFIEALNNSVDHVKHTLLPDYDYDEYARRYDENGEYKNEEYGPGSNFRKEAEFVEIDPNAPADGEEEEYDEMAIDIAKDDDDVEEDDDDDLDIDEDDDEVEEDDDDEEEEDGDDDDDKDKRKKVEDDDEDGDMKW